MAKPLGDAEFGALMARLGPFEAAPRVAVAVSGGADSLALAVLVQDWAAARGGAVAALTVDHGLRPASTREAGAVGRMLRARGLEHRVLAWRGPKPSSNVQAAARQARYALLTDWCQRRGILHLALAHHLDDQAETLLLRLGRGSGLDGLAGMAPVAELSGLRLLRPLLGIPKARLEATLEARGLPWLEDPSNQDRKHARVRLRQLLPALAAEGLSARRLAETAGRLGRARAALEAAAARLLAGCVVLYPAGFARLDPAALLAAPGEVGLRALSRLLMSVGGLEQPPRLVRLERLYRRLAVGLSAGCTLGGCRLLPRRGHILVVREPAAVAEVPVRPGQALLWDGRFEVAVARGAGPGLRLGALRPEDWPGLRATAPELDGSAVPAAARWSLPCLRDGGGVAAVPQFGFHLRSRSGADPAVCRFAPRVPLASGAFTVV